MASPCRSGEATVVCYRQPARRQALRGPNQCDTLGTNQKGGIMKRITGSGISGLIAFAAGASLVGFGMMNYEGPPDKPTTNTVGTVSDTESDPPPPTYDMTPPGVEVLKTPAVEGDDGSLGGPVNSVVSEPAQTTKSPKQTRSVQDAPPDEATTATPEDSSDPDGNGNATPGSRVKGPDGRDVVQPQPASPTPADPTPSATSQGE